MPPFGLTGRPTTAQKGDQVDLMMFYLSDRDVIEALQTAHEAGATVRVMLDPNKDAFGREKNGVPNRPVARELHLAGIPVRWCDTHGEQCHAKMLLRRRADSTATLLSGSANFTRRNLEDLNLETDIRIEGSATLPVVADAQRYFDDTWGNRNGRIASADYEAYGDVSLWQRMRSRMMEFTGFSTF
jgi:phosphatidylserine/phosphatidylglycerophosphate/cardiolipin synthase-like enzyme